MIRAPSASSGPLGHTCELNAVGRWSAGGHEACSPTLSDIGYGGVRLAHAFTFDAVPKALMEVARLCFVFQ